VDAPAPTVICDELHVVYRVVAHGGAASAAQALRRVVRGRSSDTVFKKVHAVRGVSMVAQEGDAIALIGRNGSGKSTLLRAIAGLLPPESGHVYTAGRPTLLGVNAALMRDLPGEENILLGCMAMGMSRDEARARRDWIVDFADLGEFISLPMSAYSSGMAARLRFAIAASMSHEILMIDEALATGDAEFRRRSERRIMELREEAGTVFLVSHSLGVVRLTCNRAIWLEKGRVVMDGEANEVVDAYEALYDPEAEAQERKRRRAKRRRERKKAQETARQVGEETRAARAAAIRSESPQTAHPEAATPPAADPQRSALPAADPQRSALPAADTKVANPESADTQVANPESADTQVANPESADTQVATRRQAATPEDSGAEDSGAEGSAPAQRSR
jgi:teichoic acid transport system ATP-binding protein